MSDWRGQSIVTNTLGMSFRSCCWRAAFLAAPFVCEQGVWEVLRSSIFSISELSGDVFRSLAAFLPRNPRKGL